MDASFSLLLVSYLSLLILLTPVMGRYLVNAVAGRFSTSMPGRAESRLYRVCGIDEREEMSWQHYAWAVLLFNTAGVLAVYLLQRLQGWLPWNPESLPNVAADSAINTAISFVTNTNWQGYGGETTMSYLTQMGALTVQNFFSAATGIAVAFAFMRALARSGSAGIGNFWTDITRITVYILLPISLLLAMIFISQGMLQNLSHYQAVTPLESSGEGGQVLAMGPVASQVAIKMLGTNGGGFFNTNSSHPFENPNALTNFLQMLAILLIPSGLCSAFGIIVGDRRQGWALWSAMALLFVCCACANHYFEARGNPALDRLGADAPASAEQSGGNMEGKEARFGIAASSLFATITTAASCGAVNSMHDSYTPLGGLIPLLLMQLGEVVFGGVGSGLYGMLLYAVIAVFVAGLMIGRTPEYLGKKFGPYEMKMATFAILVSPMLVLAGTAVAVSVEAGRASVLNPGPHGFSEILYALTSAANNNGSAFAGLSSNSLFYNFLMAIIMWLGRFGVILPVLAMTGSLASMRKCAQTAGTLPTHTPLFVLMLVFTVVLVGALTYSPTLALGPVVEHLLLNASH